MLITSILDGPRYLSISVKFLKLSKQAKTGIKMPLPILETRESFYHLIDTKMCLLDILGCENTFYSSRV